VDVVERGSVRERELERLSWRYSDCISCRGKHSSVNVERSYQL